MKAILSALGTAVVALALQGCGSDPESTHQASGLVRGDFSIVFHHDTGFEKRQFVTSDGRYSAVTLNELGEATFYSVSGEATGIFTISGVPQGPFYLKVDDGAQYFLEGNERSFLLGRNVVGWPEAEDAKSASTALVFAGVNGLEPWQEGGWLSVFCSNAGASGSLNVDKIGPGATSLSGLSFPYLDLRSPKLIDGARGDKAIITQFVQEEDNGVPYAAVRKAFHPAPFTMKNGQATALTGSFEDTAASPLQVIWRGSAFDELTTSVHPDAVAIGGAVSASMNPLNGGISPAEPSPALLFIANEMTAEDASFKVTFGNPYPSEWSVLGRAAFSYGVSIDMPDGSKRSVQAEISYYAPMKDIFGMRDVEPRLSPVRNIQINRMKAAGALASVGMTPTVTFSPPAIGTANHFIIKVYAPASALAQDIAPKAVLFTSKTSVVIPPGIIEPEEQYFLIITAVDDPFSGPSKPFLLGNRRAEADAVSGAFTL